MFNLNIFTTLMNHAKRLAGERAPSIIIRCDQGLQNEAVAQVFDIPLLLEMILNYAMYEDNCLSREASPENVRNFRLISPSWKEAVTKVLKSNRDPLYKVRMTADNSLNAASQVKMNGKVLDNFVRFLNSRPDPDSYAHFALQLEPEVFRMENYDNLVTFLENWGHLLVDLDLEIPVNGGSLPGMFPNRLNFPALEKLYVKLVDLEDHLPVTETITVPEENTTFWMQSLLNLSPELKTLCLQVNRIIPLSFQYLRLPQSLTKLHLECLTKPLILQCLVRNRLPNLQILEIKYRLKSGNPFPGDTIQRIFQNFGSTLRLFRLDEYPYNCTCCPRVPLIFLQFPIMANLKSLFIMGSMTSELKTEIGSVSQRFPALEHLCLYGQTDMTLRKWTKTTPAPLITQFQLEMVDGTKPRAPNGGPDNTVPISPETWSSVRLAFPNITVLSLRHKGTQFEGIQYIFREMRQLTSLTLFAVTTKEINSSQHWDSALIGAPIDLVGWLSAVPREKWTLISLNTASMPSIKQLTRLTRLELEAPRVKGGKIPLISDLLFMHALNDMTHLEHVSLVGRFKASEGIMREWKEQSRTIEYTPKGKELN